MCAVVAALLVACGDDDGRPDRTIAFVRTTEIAPESQAALLDELADAGWEVGENLTVLNEDPTSGFEDAESAADAVRGFVEDGADLLVALSTTAAMGAIEGAGDVPIIVLTNDPVASGIVTNPRAPTGGVTGVSFRVPADRTLDIARELVDADAVGLLWPATDPGAEPIVAGMRDAAESLDVPLVDARFDGDAGVAAALQEIAAAGARVVVLANAPATVRAFEAIERETQAAGLATVSNTNQNTFAVAVLAPDNLTAYRQLGRQAVRLFSGTDVEEVPLEDPGDFNLVLRPSVAQALGFEIPADLLEQADAVTD